MKEFRIQSSKQLFSLLALLAFFLVRPAGATPPDIVEIREILVGANDSVMALYEMRTENRGSHFFHGETFSLVLREIKGGKEVARRVVSRVEYIYDLDADTVDRRVIESHEVGAGALLADRGLAMALPSYVPVSIETDGWSLVMGGESDDPVTLIAAETMQRIFDIVPEEMYVSEFDRLLPIRFYHSYGSPWLFLEIAWENDDEPRQETRIVVLDRQTYRRAGG